MENAALLEENAELREAVESNGREDESMEQAEKNEDDEEMEWLRSQCGQLEATEQQLREQLAEEQEVTTQLREENVELVKQIEADARMRQQVEAQLDAQVKQKQKEVEELSKLNASLREQLAAAAEKTEALEEEHKKAVAAAVASAAAAPVGSPSAASTASSSSTSTNGVEATANDAEIKRLTVELHTLRSTVQSLQAENTRLRNAEASSSSSASTQLLLPSKRVSTDLLKLNYTPDQLADKYLAERTRNAALLSRLQTVCGNIQVFCRVRPVIGEELAKSQGSRLGVNVVNQSDVAAMDVRPERIFPSGADGMQAADADDGDLEDMMLDVNAAWKVFTFDRVLGPEETQLDVFREVEPIAQSVVEGFKACIFTYGQTGSGKTYTMEGTPSDPGLNYRVLSHIFQSVVLRGPIYDPDRMEEEDMVDTELLEVCDELRPVRATNEVCYHIQVGVLEIYNESLRDLVDPTNGKPLEIRQDPTTGDIVVPHLTMATASSPEKTIEILRTAQTNRVTGKTDVHAHSSRSHSIVILQISTRTSSTPSSQNDSDETVSMGSYVSGKLYMVDLAGSERVKKSNVSGAMLKEAAHINKSLSALADVMEALDKKHAHVPYRNSKLTYLLQDVLNTSCKTVMIVNCGPTIECASETFRSLQLAERVRNIVVGRNSIVKNKKDILSAKRAFSEIQSLKQQIQRSERKIKQSQQTVVAMVRCIPLRS
jgi:kinesin family member C2/C3